MPWSRAASICCTLCRRAFAKRLHTLAEGCCGRATADGTEPAKSLSVGTLARGGVWQKGVLLMDSVRIAVSVTVLIGSSVLLVVPCEGQNAPASPYPSGVVVAQSRY